MALVWLTRTSSELPEAAGVRETARRCQEVVRVTLGDEVSATTVPPGVRSRSFSTAGLPTEEVVAARTQASAA